MVSKVIDQVGELVVSLTIFQAGLDFNIEDLIANDKNIAKRNLVSKSDFEERAGKLFDILDDGKKTLDPWDIANFLKKNPDCAEVLGFKKDETSTAGFTLDSNFAKVLNNTAFHEPTRAEFSKIIGGQAYEEIAEKIGETALALKASQVSLGTHQAGQYLADTYTRTHPDMNGSLNLPPQFFQSHDLNHDKRFNIEELRGAFKDINAHPDKYIKAAQKLEQLQQNSPMKTPIGR